MMFNQCSVLKKCVDTEAEVLTEEEIPRTPKIPNEILKL